MVNDSCKCHMVSLLAHTTCVCGCIKRAVKEQTELRKACKAREEKKNHGESSLFHTNSGARNHEALCS